MSTPDRTAETPDLVTSAPKEQDDLTRSVGTRLATPAPAPRAPWWKRLLGRG